MLSEIISTKLRLADQSCEAQALDQIVAFYKQIKYENGRFVFPSLQQVSSVWLKLLREKEQTFISEIQRVSAVFGNKLNPEEYITIVQLVRNLLNDERYSERLKIFVQGIERKAGSYGLTFNPQEHRLDLAYSTYEVGVRNIARQTLASVETELKLHTQVNSDIAEKFQEAASLLELKPNVMGIGVNFNEVINRIFRKKKK